MIDSPEAQMIQIGDLTLDRQRHLAINGEGAVQLTPQESRLLGVLMEHPEEDLARDFLMHAAWNWNISAPHQARTLEVHICWLRRKLEENPRRPRLILTVRGTGYRFTGKP